MHLHLELNYKGESANKKRNLTSIIYICIYFRLPRSTPPSISTEVAPSCPAKSEVEAGSCMNVAHDMTDSIPTSEHQHLTSDI